LFLGGCIHNKGYLKGVALQPEPVLGPASEKESHATYLLAKLEAVFSDLNMGGITP